MEFINEQLDSKIEEFTALFMYWNYVKEHGSSSPIWTDGQDLNFTRGEMERLEKEIKSLAEKYKKEVRLEELPPRVSDGYMLKAGRIKERALEVFEECYGEDYMFILKHGGKLNEEQKEETGVAALFARMEDFAAALERDHAVKLKQYGNNKSLLKDISSCKSKLEELLEELKELESAPVLLERKEVYEQMRLFG